MAKLGTDAIMADVYASIPAAGVAGRLYWATDTKRLYRDSGSAWVELGYTEGARVYHSATQSIANNTVTTLTFDSESYDTSGIHEAVINPTRLTCQTAGKYLIYGMAKWADNTTGFRGLYLWVNQTTYIAAVQNTATPQGVREHLIMMLYNMVAADYVEMRAVQSSGGALDIQRASDDATIFGMHRIG